MTTWIYLSPHFDDAALSCGGLIHQQVRTGDSVQIWTICAGIPPEGDFSPFAESLHQRWGIGSEAVEIRRLEDQRSCEILGVTPRTFSVPDCIYRLHPETQAHLYDSEESLNASLHRGEEPLIQELCKKLSGLLPENCRMVVPLTIGNHVDHQLVRRAAERLGAKLDYYEDFPYVVEHSEKLQDLLPVGWGSKVVPLIKADILVWQESIAAHQSQIDTFWPSVSAMKTAIDQFSNEVGGARVWREKP